MTKEEKILVRLAERVAILLTAIEESEVRFDSKIRFRAKLVDCVLDDYKGMLRCDD